jgi:hypothetical protein
MSTLKTPITRRCPDPTCREGASLDNRKRGGARWLRRLNRAAREGAGDDCLLMVDAGASNMFWPHGINGRCAPPTW